MATFTAPPDAAIVEAARSIAWQPLTGHRFPERFEAEIEVRLLNGETRRQRIDSVRGGPERPLSESEVREKFRANAVRVMGADEVEALCGAILAIDTAPTLARLTEALGRHGA